MAAGELASHDAHIHVISYYRGGIDSPDLASYCNAMPRLLVM